MWFVWPVLSIGKLASTDPSSYYIEALATGTDDYYLSAGEQPGRWLGRGAAQLGLSGSSSQARFAPC